MIADYQPKRYESYADNKGYGEVLVMVEKAWELYNQFMAQNGKSLPTVVHDELKRIEKQIKEIEEEFTQKKQSLRLVYADQLAELQDFVVRLTALANEKLNEE